MFPKKQRVTKDTFEKSAKTGSRKAGLHFSLTITPSPDAISRFAVVVSKKVAPTAVERNKTRRRVFGALEAMSPIQPATYIFFAKKGAPELSYKNLEAEVRTLIKEK